MLPGSKKQYKEFKKGLIEFERKFRQKNFLIKNTDNS